MKNALKHAKKQKKEGMFGQFATCMYLCIRFLVFRK